MERVDEINLDRKQRNKINKRKLIIKWKLENNLYCTEYKNKIINNHDVVWCPPLDIKSSTIKTNSWFTMNKCVNSIKNNANNIYVIAKDHKYNKCTSHNKDNINAKEKALIKCYQINMHLTIYQKEIIHNWFKAYNVMYNKTIKYSYSYSKNT